MVTAVDTNILLDVLVSDPLYLDASKALLDQAVAGGAIVMSEVVYAELASVFPERSELDRFLNETGIRLEPSNRDALFRASEAWKVYRSQVAGAGFQCPECGHHQVLVCDRCKRRISSRQHVLSDFLIGGHALEQADVLLTRDRGYYRTYFPELRIIGPEE